MYRRKSGILLHITSLPSPYGIGDIGPSAYRFADFLCEAGQALWQILPLNPIDSAHANSPYSSISAFANNTLLISPELLARDSFVSKQDIKPLRGFSKERVCYTRVRAHKERLLNLAYENFKTRKPDPEYKEFLSLNSYWLEDLALFKAIRQNFRGLPWSEWPEEIRNREPGAMKHAKTGAREIYNREIFFQYLFLRQWNKFKDYCNKKGIGIIGDTPIYVNFDSADVWKDPAIFKLDREKRPIFVSGVPPDYFSRTGQRWGNPVYDWDALKKTRYVWWTQRIGHVLSLFDMVRIDHFRGFVGYWEIPAGEKTAVNGKWIKAPADDFFSVVLGRFPGLPIIAEDLGVITTDVRKIMRHFGFPGMKVLLFAFGEERSDHPYLPHNYKENCVVYTGTHDNNTISGWFRNEAGYEEKERLFRYLGCNILVDEIHWALIRLAMESPARICIIPMQDVLGLDENARMNKPGTRSGNWEWRLLSEDIAPGITRKLREITESGART